MRKYIGTTDIAKIIREMLKKAYPETKFSVRSSKYAGGSSIDIRWTDGPTEDQVKAKTGYFQGADFDGMQDLKTYRGEREWQGEMVHFSVDFIFTKRAYSEAMLRAAAEKEAARFGMATPEILVSTYDSGAYMNSQTRPNNSCGSGWTLEMQIRRVIEGRD